MNLSCFRPLDGESFSKQDDEEISWDDIKKVSVP